MGVRESCAHDADFCSGRASTLHADPTDCSKFYSCLGAITFSFPCTPGLLFNDAYKVCDWPTNVKCATTTTQTAEASATETPSAETTTADDLPSSAFPSVLTTSAAGLDGHPASSLATSSSSRAPDVTADFVDSKTTASTFAPAVNTTRSQSDNSTTAIDVRVLMTAEEAATTLTSAATTFNSVTKTASTTLTTAAKTVATTLTSALVTAAVTTSTPTSGPKDKQAFRPSPFYCTDRKDGLYEDPENCGEFYQCHRGYTYHFQCPRGLVFNQRYQYCDWPFNVDCVKEQRIATVPGSGTGYSSSTARTTLSSAPRPTGSSSPGCSRIVCYVSNWSKYRFGKGKFTVGDINPNLCTHVIYSFVKLSGNTLAVTELADEPSDGDVGDFARVTRLKELNPKLKVLLAVGGWSSSSTDFSLMASSPESREEFVSTTVRFLRKRNFDGLDFDWEFPANEMEKELFALLCEKLRAAFDSEADGDDRLLLTVAVSAGKWTIDTAYNVPRMSASVDFINLMSYDLHGPWDKITGHHSPLFPGSWEEGQDANFNVDWVANYWVSKGAPRHKLIIGAPLYARTFTLADKGDAGTGSPILGGGSPGPYTNEAGYLSYYEVCLRRGAQQTRRTMESQKVPFLISGNQWVGYDDRVSLREKVRYIRHNGFGGVMVWELSQDDFTGMFCQEGKFPLLTSINDECYI